jgi:CBS domain-containing protein
MQVQDIMTRDVKSCRWDTNLAAATAILWAGDCGALPVLDGDRKVVGMITDRDICIAAGTRNWVPSDMKVFEVVPQTVHTCAPQDDVHAALETMKAQKVRRLPVVDKDGRIEGILCLNDIVRNARKSNSLSYDDVIETVQAICEHRTLRFVRAA